MGYWKLELITDRLKPHFHRMIHIHCVILQMVQSQSQMCHHVNILRMRCLRIVSVTDGVSGALLGWKNGKCHLKSFNTTYTTDALGSQFKLTIQNKYYDYEPLVYWKPSRTEDIVVAFLHHFISNGSHTQYIFENVDVVIQDIVFANNVYYHINDNDAIIHAQNHTKLFIRNCTFQSNHKSLITASDSSIEIIDTAFKNNIGHDVISMVHVHSTTLVVINSI
eukprot:879379_1